MDVKSESGQSILEFLITLPLMIGLVMLMIRVNTYMQMGIVNQQYARAQVLFVAGNGAEYPQRPKIVADLASVHYNQFVVAVSEDQDLSDSDPTKPQLATTYLIVPSTQTGYNDNAQTESTLRGNLRVRSSVTLCLPMLVNSSGAYMRPIGASVMPPGQTASGFGNSPSQFQYCSAPQIYDTDDDGHETI